MLPRKVIGLLDLVVVVLSALRLGELVGAPLEHAAVELLCVVGIALFGVGWLLWRMGGHRWGLALMCSAVLGQTLALGGGSISSILMVLGVALVTLGYGSQIGLVTATGFLLVMVVAAPTSARSVVSVLMDFVFAYAILLLGVVIGAALRELMAERRRNAELLEEVRRAALTEQELMLADERSRSARELHDGLGHQLTLVVLSLEFAERMRERDAERAWAEVHQGHETAAEALAHMRRWVRALNPPREDAVSGTAAFEAIARSFRGTGLDVVVAHTGEERELDRSASLFALRLVQEGLTNVVRHSSATTVQLAVDWQPRALRLVLTDDGGRPDQLIPGFGLRSLSERAQTLGGSFEAHATDTGVQVIGEIPTDGAK